MLYPSFLHHSFSSFYPARCHAAIASASFLGSPLFVFFSPLCAWGQMYGRVSVDCLGLVLWCGMSQDVRGCREDNAHLHTPHGPWALPSTVCSHISPFQHHTSTHTLSRSPPNILFHHVASNSSSVRKEGGADNRFRILQYEGCKTNKAGSFMQPGCLLKPTPHHVIPGRLCQPDLRVAQWRLCMLLAERDVFTSSTACSVWCAACGWPDTQFLIADVSVKVKNTTE